MKTTVAPAIRQMIPLNRTYAPIQALVDELARCGMRHAVTCPGSRNAPIALSLAADERIEAVSVIDERAGGFLALGMAKASGRPVAVTCTSGSAAANLAPAVVEAWEARVPLIVLTADRPPELRDVGAGQAIDQLDLYGSAAKWFVEVGSHEPGRESAVHHRALACRAWHTARSARPGPVHLNVALREPLAPAPEEMDPGEWKGRPDGRPWVELRAPSPAPHAGDVHDLAARLAAAPRAAVVCGPTHEPVADAVARLCERGDWPALAEPASGVRCGDHDRARVIAGYDVLLRHPAFFDSHAPDLVLRLGDTPTSKPLRAWLAGAPQVVFDPHAAWHEPTRTAELLLGCEAAPACDALAAALEMTGVERDPAWLGSWREADALVPGALAAAADPFEPKMLAALEAVLPDGGIMWAASSMPVRHLETFFPNSPSRIRFLANRGANGIDGTIASAAGAALASGAPTTVVVGDLALLHDLDGLLAATRAGTDLTIVCLNNGGGAIFDFLPVAEHTDPALYEAHIATPAQLDLVAVAALARLDHRVARTPDELRAAHREGPGLIEVPGDRDLNVREQRAAIARVASALG